MTIKIISKTLNYDFILMKKLQDASWNMVRKVQKGSGASVD